MINWFYFQRLLILLLAVCLLTSCENDLEKVRDLSSKELGVEEGKDVVLNYTVAGKIKSVLKAPIMLRVEDSVSYIEFPKTLFALFYNEKGEAESKLTAGYGRYKENEEIVYLRDSVVVLNFQKGDTLFCDELYWDRSRIGAEFYTDKPVRIRKKAQIIDGLGMEASQDFKNHNIKEVTGVITIPTSQFPQ